MTSVEWRQGGADEVNELLRAEHYLGPIRAGGAQLVVLGQAGGRVVAAQVWRRPTARRLPNDGTWLELSRWCLTPAAGAYAGSRQHGAAVRIVREVMPSVTTFVSYSDPGHGHSGALYRSCNWVWRPTWHRLRTPPTGNGAWQRGRAQGVKDRWLFPVRPDAGRDAVTFIDDPGAIRFWLQTATPEQRRWARTHPQLAPLVTP